MCRLNEHSFALDDGSWDTGVRGASGYAVILNITATAETIAYSFSCGVSESGTPGFCALDLPHIARLVERTDHKNQSLHSDIGFEWPVYLRKSPR